MRTGLDHSYRIFVPLTSHLESEPVDRSPGGGPALDAPITHAGDERAVRGPSATRAEARPGGLSVPCGRVPCMINDVDSVDWSSMGHAYGPAVDVPVWLRAMASPDPEVRERAFGDFCGAAHHQGDVYVCTVASLPFLFALADDPATPDRASVVGLLVSIGRESVDRDDGGVRFAPDGTASTACTDGAAMMRDRSEAFVAYAADADPGVRRAAIAGLGLFIDDADRAVGVLRSRLPAASGIAERLLVVGTTADLALRLPAARADATAWLRGLADDTSADADVRLAALVHHARCVPEAVGDDTVPVAVGLLRRLTPAPPPGTDEKRCRSGSGTRACTPAPDTASPDTPPQIVAAFADMERHNRVHAPTTPLLRALHKVLDHRVPERTARAGPGVGLRGLSRSGRDRAGRPGAPPPGGTGAERRAGARVSVVVRQAVPGAEEDPGRVVGPLDGHGQLAARLDPAGDHPGGGAQFDLGPAVGGQ